MSRRKSTWLAGLVLGLALSAAAPSVASATYYTIRLTPGSVPSGSRATISAEIKRYTSGTQVGSANITTPTGFTLVSASIPGPSTATKNGNTAELRNLGLAVNQSKVATLVVDTPCAPATGTWTEFAKSNGSYSGSPISDHGDNLLQTTTTGTCGVSFTAQPTDVQVGSPIPGTPSGPVKVSVTDGAGAALAAPRSVTIGLGTAPAGAALTGTTTATTTGGVASFSNLAVTKAGTYTLSATSGGASTTSSSFKASQALTRCENNVDCSATASISGTINGQPYTNTVTIQSAQSTDGGVPDDSGTLVISYDIGANFTTCGNAAYAFASPNREVFDGPSNRGKIVHSTISHVILAATGRAPGSLRTCLIAPYQFSLGLLAGNATPIGDFDGDGNQDWIGLLPDCLEIIDLGIINVLVGPPCQLPTTTNAAGDATTHYKLAPHRLDPAVRH